MAIAQKDLDALFPASRTDAFFEALFGGAEEGAYDIRLVFEAERDNALDMAFELKEREGKCLRCSLTYGLPEVFARHKVLNVAELAKDLGHLYGWDKVRFELGPTKEKSKEIHVIPFRIFKEA